MGFARQGYETEQWPVVKARWYKAVTSQRREVRVVVIHTIEIAETERSAEQTARYFSNPSDGRKVSAHICVDNDSIVQCVLDNNVAFAAPGTNHNGIQIELAGTAEQTHGEWADEYSTAVLEQAANATAQYCLKYGLPVKHLTNDELRDGQEGIIGHYQASAVYGGTHWDPGPNFPWNHFLERVRHYVNSHVGQPDNRRPCHIVERGDTLTQIARMKGFSLNEILSANPQIVDPNYIQVHDPIYCPGESTIPTPDHNGDEIETPTDIDMDEVDVMARTIFGEARGESELGQIAVGWVIRNRVARNTWYGNTIEAVCWKPYQFSCWNPDSPSLHLLRSVTKSNIYFARCWDAAVKVLSLRTPDPTLNATHYYANYINMPSWAWSATFTVKIGVHLFYKDVD